MKDLNLKKVKSYNRNILIGALLLLILSIVISGSINKNEVLDNNSFIAKKSKTYEEEKNVADKAPVDTISINNLNENETDIEFQTGKLSILIDDRNSIHMKGPVSEIKEIEFKL